MAIGSVIAGPHIAAHPSVIPTSLQSRWFTLNEDAKTAVANATDLLTPTAVVAAQVHWCAVPTTATRILVRFAYTGTAGTNPIVRIIGAYPVGSLIGVTTANQFSATAGATDYATYLRLDNVDQNAAGVTLADATPWTDGTNKRGAPSTLSGYDLCGCSYVTALVETAANTVTLGWVEGLFLN